MKYYYQIEGLLRNNIGDVLQGIVAKSLLPPGASVADREALADMNSLEPAFLLANGWYMHNFEKFPPPDNVRPLYISVHLAKSKLLTNPEIRAHFLKHSPIGCRDKKTLNLFLGWGIPAYYSGCLTLTAEKTNEPDGAGCGEILLVDNIDHPIPRAVHEKLEKILGSPMVRVSHDPPYSQGNLEDYFIKAEQYMMELLSSYSKAGLVVTTKIHCALPCLGMGTPVVLIHPDPNDPRLASVGEFMKIYSYQEILNSAKLIIPAVNQDAIDRRKFFLKELVEKSISINGNIIRFPNSLKFKIIKTRSVLTSKLYWMVIRLLITFGLADKRMKRCYRSVS